MLETYFWVDSEGGSTKLEEPDFEENDPTIDDEECEYCGKDKGFPTPLGLHTVILCSDCQTFRTDEIFYDLKGI